MRSGRYSNAHRFRCTRERFGQWLDTLETQWHEPPSTLPEVTATV